MRLGDAAAYGGGDDAEFAHELGELRWIQGLRAVGKRVVWIVVNFDQDAVGTCSDGCAGHGRDFVAAAGAVRGIGNDGKMRQSLDYGNRGDVEGVAKISIEGADAALAKDYV